MVTTECYEVTPPGLVKALKSPGHEVRLHLRKAPLKPKEGLSGPPGGFVPSLGIGRARGIGFRSADTTETKGAPSLRLHSEQALAKNARMGHPAYKIGRASWPQEFSWCLVRALSLRSESSTSSIHSGGQTSRPVTPRCKSA